MKVLAGLAAFIIVSHVGNKVINGKIIAASREASRKNIRDIMADIEPKKSAAA